MTGDRGAVPATAAARGHRWALATLAVTVAGTALAAAGIWHARTMDGGGALSGELLAALAVILPYGVAGAVLVDRRPDLPFGWILAAGCTLHTAFTAATLALWDAALTGRTTPPLGPLVAAGTALGFVQLPLQGLANLRFPSGHLSGRKGVVLQWLIVAGTLIGLAAAALLPSDEGGSPPELARMANPLSPAGSLQSRVAAALIVAVPATILLAELAGLGVVVRFRRATGLERQQLKWRAVHVVYAIAVFPLIVTGLVPLGHLGATLFVVTLAVPVLRYRLWAIDTILSRSVAYASVTAVLTALYALVAVVGARVASRPLGSTVAVVAVVLAFDPVRRRVGELVDRLFYGRRNDPYTMLRHLGQRLRDVTVPGQALPAVADTVCSALRLPYAAIERAGDGALLASAGQPGPTVDRWPLVFEGRLEGWLVASPRRGEDRVEERDRQLLDDVARQIASAVHADALTADLLRSRQQLVTAREEERRRLRRDLHDGLGPVLAGVVLKLDAARARLVTAPDGAEQLLGEAKEASTRAIADLRQVVYGLRPPSLDDLGLLGALRVQLDRLAAGTGLTVTVDGGPDPSDLPAAVEVATYRTVVEAVANVIRHSGATHCRVAFTPDRDEAPGGPARAGLTVTVTDDGPGSGGPWTPGVGLTAMRERAEELGGTLVFGPGPDGAGGQVTCRFPVPASPPVSAPPPGAGPPEAGPPGGMDDEKETV